MRIESPAYPALLGLMIAGAVLAGCVAPPSAPSPPPAAVPVYVPMPAAARKPEPVSEPVAKLEQPTAPTPAPEPQTPAQARLAEGIALYESGDFNGAIKKLTTSAELAPKVIAPELRPAVLKYSAFSYCVTNRRTLCRRQFDALLAVDPLYELTLSEAGHPIWGPVFIQAKRAVAAKRK